MTQLAGAGWELLDGSEFDAVGGTPAYVASPVHCGVGAASCNASGEEFRKTVSAGNTHYARVYVRFNALPNNNTICAVMEFFGGGAINCQLAYARNASGKLQVWIRSYFPAHYLYINYTWAINTWYCVELAMYRNAAGWYKVWVNDSLIGTYSANTSGSAQTNQIRVGQNWSNYTVTEVVDDFACADAGPIGSHDQSFDQGFEGGFTGFNAQVDTPSIDTLTRHCGSSSMKATVAQWASSGAYVNLGHSKEWWGEVFVQFSAMPVSGKYIEYARLSVSSTVDVLRLRVYNDGGTVKWGMLYRHNGAMVSAYSATATNPVVGTWYGVKVWVRLSDEDGSAVGVYDIWVGTVGAPTHLADIAVGTRDTDYSGMLILYCVTTTDDPAGATVYTDCVLVQTTDPGDLHAAGSEDVETIVEAPDYEPVGGIGLFQVWRNGIQISVFSFSLTDEQNGYAELVLPYDV